MNISLYNIPRPVVKNGGISGGIMKSFILFSILNSMGYLNYVTHAR